MTLPYGNSRSIELAVALRVPARVVFRALSEPVEIVRWLGREAWGFPRPGGALDILLGPEDLGLEGGNTLQVGLTFRDVSPQHIHLETTDPRLGRPIPISIALRGEDDRTIVTLLMTGFDPGKETDPFYRAALRACQFHLANLKSILEGGEDLRGTVEGDLFRFEGSAAAAGQRIATAQVLLPVPRAAAFHAFTDRDALAVWWPGLIDLPTADSLRFEAVVEWGARARHHLIGTLVSWAEPQSLRLEWSEVTPEGTLEAAALVAFLREGGSAGGASRVVVVERSGSPLPTWAASLASSFPGWDGLLARLARYVRGV